jgi:uncharacterized protein
MMMACALHTDGHTTGDPTLLACWDADRLDLGRVGIVPKPKLLCTDMARALLPWAHERATADYVPAAVLASWGITPERVGRQATVAGLIPDSGRDSNFRPSMNSR